MNPTKAEWTHLHRDMKCPCGNHAAMVCKPCAIEANEIHVVCFATDCREGHEIAYHGLEVKE